MQLADHFERAVLASHLRARGDVLPAQEPLHELGGGDWGNLLAQGGDGEAVNAGEQAALAPFGFGWGGSLAGVGRPSGT